MLYIGYLITLDGQNIKIISFGKFPFLTCRGWKIAPADCALDPLGPPPPTHIV